jgi:uncharacterized protein (DUF2062 family)
MQQAQTIHPPKKRRQFRKSRRTIRYAYLKLTRLRSSPPAIARGFAAGAFTGMMPLFGVQTIVAVGLATLVKGNPIAAALTTWVSNPITFLPLYMVNFKVGQLLLGTHGLMLSLHWGMPLIELSKVGAVCLITLTIGCVATGIPTATDSYFLGLYLARRWRQNRYQRRLDRRYQSAHQ